MIELLDRSVPVPDEVLSGELDGLAWYRCGSKVRFPTRRVARWWRRWARREYGVKFRVVRCDDCRGFHLTKGKRWRGGEPMPHIAADSDTSDTPCVLDTPCKGSA